MKIIISPSKTQTKSNIGLLNNKDMLFPKKHKKVLAALRKLSKTELTKRMKISNDLANKTYQDIKNYNSNTPFHAFPSFNGLVFKNLDKAAYQISEYAYIESHVRVLDAFYGILEPGTLIKPYRLDMKMNIGLNLYKHWELDSYFKDELIINLASAEFSSILHDVNMVTVGILQYKDGKHINQATYSKMARGLILDYMIKHKVQTIEDLKSFNLDGYDYNQELSNDNEIIFTR